jgi:hypothetical protein
MDSPHNFIRGSGHSVGTECKRLIATTTPLAGKSAELHFVDCQVARASCPEATGDRLTLLDSFEIIVSVLI